MDFFRSLLSVPGQRQNMIDKAFTLEPDGVMFDLEDAVPPSLKDQAREMVAATLARPKDARSKARFVRVNGTTTGRTADDIRAIVHEHLEGIVMPKVETVDEIRAVDAQLTTLEKERRLRAGQIRLLISIESAKGIRWVDDLVVASPRVMAVFMGGEDFALDLGLPVIRSGAGQEQVYARSRVMIAGAMARIFTVDQGSMDFRDLDAFRRHVQASRQLGFTTGWCIHPNQIAISNEVFSPTPEEVELSRKVVAAFDDAKAQGLGAVMMGGQFIELPIVERAQRTLRLHEAIQARS